MNAHGARVRLCARAFCVRLYDEKEGVQKMADLIDREAAIKALSHGEGCGNICSRAIRRIPAVDAVEVVRCKDCESYNNHFSQKGFGWCEEEALRIVSDNFYCGNAKRVEKDG